jgi:hypothetical protein
LFSSKEVPRASLGTIFFSGLFLKLYLGSLSGYNSIFNSFFVSTLFPIIYNIKQYYAFKLINKLF